MKNNNKKVIAQIAKEEYYADRRRHMILTAAIAFAVMTLFCVFSFAAGKIDTDMLREARTRGVVTNTTLERATQEQYEKIRKLPYIRDVGKCVRFGSTLEARCAVADEVAWEKIKKPAFTDIHGKYPQEEMEVMLPMRTLKASGISDPQVGMKLSGSVSFFDKSLGTKEYDFILSGYYTEYIATLQYGPPDAFFSQAFVDSIFGDQELDATLYLRQDDRIAGRVVENRLYADIEMRDTSQQFLGEITASGQAMFTLAGGFDTILILAVVILISVGLLIYNVLHISFERNIRQYGLLKTLGTTRKQLRGIVFWQVRRTVFFGSLAGAALGVLVALLVIPILLSRMYLYRIGSAAGMITFRPVLLIASVLFSGVVTFLSSALAIRRTVKLTPIEAVSYMEKADIRYQGRTTGKNGKQKFQLSQMAWRNIIRFKKRFFISAFCLSLGFIASLAIVMISKGTDTRNEIEHKYWDIYVSTMVSAFECVGVFENHAEDTLFPDELLHKIESLPGIEESDIARGGFVEVRVDEKALDLRREDMWLDIYLYSYPSTVQILSDEYFARLKTFAQEQGLYLDVDAVMEGEGVILLHDHALSPTQIEMSKDTVGMTLGIYDIVSKQKTKDMRFCGYLDLQQEGLPEILYTNKSDSDVYLLASEKGFRNIKAREQNFHIFLNAQPGGRVALSREVEKLVEEYNRKFIPPEGYEDFQKFGYWDPLMLDVLLKIDTLQEMKDYIVSNRLVLGALCAVLLLMGIVNYMDVTITGLMVRKKEFAVMESIGLTRRQLKKMLILEGIFYSLIISILTGVLGGGVFFLIGRLMRQKMEYFVIQYPIVEFAGCVITLFLSCIAIVLFLYWKYGEESISLRLRIYAD